MSYWFFGVSARPSLFLKSAGGEEISGRGRCRDHRQKVCCSPGPITNQAAGSHRASFLASFAL